MWRGELPAPKDTPPMVVNSQLEKKWQAITLMQA